MDDMESGKRLYDKFMRIFREKKGTVFLFLGIAGMSLILLSTIFTAREKANPSVGTVNPEPAIYMQQMEERLTSLVGKIDGVGKCEVMITMENGPENIYAIEESQNVNETSRFEGEAVRQQTQQQNSEQKYIVVDAGGGKKEALLKTQRQPTVQGVVVVCEGASNMVVQERVTQAVTTALGIPYTKVCVTKISK